MSHLVRVALELFQPLTVQYATCSVLLLGELAVESSQGAPVLRHRTESRWWCSGFRSDDRNLGSMWAYFLVTPVDSVYC